MPKPVGQITRGKTAPNRLRQTDSFLRLAYPALLQQPKSLYVDLGYGAYPVTTLETFNRLRKFNPRLQVIGVEIDQARVAEAKPFERVGLEFRLGGFNLPLTEPASIVRAFNVLRQYNETDFSAAINTLSAHIKEGGILLEGTCDPTGRLLNFNLYEQWGGRLTRAALIFAPRLSALRPDFTPKAFQAVLPKNYIHHAAPGSAIEKFFKNWHAAWQHTRTTDPRQTFVASALRLAEYYGYDLEQRLSFLRRGFLVISKGEIFN